MDWGAFLCLFVCSLMYSSAISECFNIWLCCVYTSLCECGCWSEYVCACVYMLVCVCVCVCVGVCACMVDRWYGYSNM
jgi:ABC-type proline/glycine betaine transport system permease subunit